MKSNFEEELSRRVLLCDGAMGTMIYHKGIPFEKCYEALNLSQPRLIGEIHRGYISAGADIIEANTFGANRFRLKRHGLGNKVRDINLKAVETARSAQRESGRSIYIAGSIGPLGEPLSPLGSITAKESERIFIEQAEALTEGGVDLFIIETFSEPNEIYSAIAAVKKSSDKTVVAEASFSANNKTYLGFTPQEMVKAMIDGDADIIGVNCSTGPKNVLEIMRTIANMDKKPFCAMPNAGIPQSIGGELVYPYSSEDFAEYVGQFIDLGVRIIGGCCGTTPKYIKLVREVINGFQNT